MRGFPRSPPADLVLAGGGCGLTGGRAEPQDVEWQQHLCMCWVFLGGGEKKPWKSVFVLYKHHDVVTSIKTYFTVESSIVVRYRYFV